jgi:predicted nucleic acid-binding protein
VADPRHARGLIGTSVVIDLELIEPAELPGEIAVSAVTIAELAAGPHAPADPAERARRQDRLQLAFAVDVNTAARRLSCSALLRGISV